VVVDQEEPNLLENAKVMEEDANEQKKEAAEGSN
jgi:hypothetical protein